MGEEPPVKEPQQPSQPQPAPQPQIQATPIPAQPKAKPPQVQPQPQQLSEEQPGSVLELTDLNWESVVEKGKKPVAIMFYSPTCVFCRQMDPYFRGYAVEYKDSVTFARLNIMVNLWTSERYGVRSTPTFKFFCDGRPVQEMVGAVYPAILKKMIDEVLVHGKECAKNSTAIDYEITGYG
jgi:thioredoxin-like negative regulator of GroEL